MKTSFSRKVRCFCLFGRVKRAYEYLLSIKANSCLKSTANLSDPKNSKFIVCVCFLPILRVYWLTNITQVGNAVVVFDPVDVVNSFARPLSEHIEPREAMGRILISVNEYHPVSSWMNRPCYFIGAMMDIILAPYKVATFRCVKKYLAQTFRCKIGLSHATLRSQLVRAEATFARFLGPFILRRPTVICNG